jgi:hypothetical protein
VALLTSSTKAVGTSGAGARAETWVATIPSAEMPRTEATVVATSILSAIAPLLGLKAFSEQRFD